MVEGRCPLQSLHCQHETQFSFFFFWGVIGEGINAYDFRLHFRVLGFVGGVLELVCRIHVAVTVPAPTDFLEGPVTRRHS